MPGLNVESPTMSPGKRRSQRHQSLSIESFCRLFGRGGHVRVNDGMWIEFHQGVYRVHRNGVVFTVSPLREVESLAEEVNPPSVSGRDRFNPPIKPKAAEQKRSKSKGPRPSYAGPGRLSPRSRMIVRCSCGKVAVADSNLCYSCIGGSE